MANFCLLAAAAVADRSSQDLVNPKAYKGIAFIFSLEAESMYHAQCLLATSWYKFFLAPPKKWDRQRVSKVGRCSTDHLCHGDSHDDVDDDDDDIMDVFLVIMVLPLMVT